MPIFFFDKKVAKFCHICYNASMNKEIDMFQFFCSFKTP